MVALAVLLGGGSLLTEIARHRTPASIVLAILVLTQIYVLRRIVAAGGPNAGIESSRSIAFIAATIAALFFVAAPARWSAGACIVAVEFGFVLELLGRLAPRDAQAGARPAETLRK